GKVDDMYPGDKDLKPENRASLRAQFVKGSSSDGSHDLGKSAWNIYLGNDLLLTASVDELSGGRTDLMYSSIASKEFATNLMARVRKEGANKVKSLIKGAQAAAAAPVEEVPADLPAEMTADAPATDAELEPEVGTGEGDPAEVVTELSEKLRDLSSDLVEAVAALSGEHPEMGEDMA